MKNINNLLAFLGGLILAACIFVGIMMSMDASAQDNWITCQNIRTGNIQMFPGMQCPHNWAPV